MDNDICLMRLSCDLYASHIMSMLFQFTSCEQQELLSNHLMGINGQCAVACYIRKECEYVIPDLVMKCCDDFYCGFSNLFKLCKSKQGCRVVLSMISHMNANKLSQFIQCFADGTAFGDTQKGNLYDLLLCENGHYIIQKIIELKFPFKQIEFIRNELQSNLGMIRYLNILLMVCVATL